MRPTTPSARNAPCHCGSGRKFKKCHFLLEHERARQEKIAWREQRERERAAFGARRLDRNFGLGPGTTTRLLALVAMSGS